MQSVPMRGSKRCYEEWGSKLSETASRRKGPGRYVLSEEPSQRRARRGAERNLPAYLKHLWLRLCGSWRLCAKPFQVASNCFAQDAKIGEDAKLGGIVIPFIGIKAIGER